MGSWLFPSYTALLVGGCEPAAVLPVCHLSARLGRRKDGSSLLPWVGFGHPEVLRSLQGPAVP